MTNKFITSIGLFILFVFGSIIIGLIMDSKAAPERQAVIVQYAANNSKVKQLILNGDLSEYGRYSGPYGTKEWVEHILKVNNLVLDYADMDEIDKYRTLTIKDSDYRLETIGNQNNWTVARISKG